MTHPASLDPKHIMPVSPVVAKIVDDLLAAHPTVATLPHVQVAILAVTARYIDRLRGIDVPVPSASQVDVLRCLMFLANTASPLREAPEHSAASLVAIARDELRASNHVATEAFDRAIAQIVGAVREVARRRQNTHRRAEPIIGETTS